MVEDGAGPAGGGEAFGELVRVAAVRAGRGAVAVGEGVPEGDDAVAALGLPAAGDLDAREEVPGAARLPEGLPGRVGTVVAGGAVRGGRGDAVEGDGAGGLRQVEGDGQRVEGLDGEPRGVAEEGAAGRDRRGLPAAEAQVPHGAGLDRAAPGRPRDGRAGDPQRAEP